MIVIFQRYTKDSLVILGVQNNNLISQKVETVNVGQLWYISGGCFN